MTSRPSRPVPPLHQNKSHVLPEHQWLYEKPKLKTRTQERFDAKEYLTRRVEVEKASPPWWYKFYQRNPRRFMYFAVCGTLGTFYSAFIYDIAIRPSILLFYYAKEAAFPRFIEYDDTDCDTAVAVIEPTTGIAGLPAGATAPVNTASMLETVSAVPVKDK